MMEANSASIFHAGNNIGKKIQKSFATIKKCCIFAAQSHALMGVAR